MVEAPDRVFPSWGAAILTVLGGVVSAQAITVGVLPILSRLYSPQDFGVLTLLLALSGLVAPFAGLRLEAAAMLPTRTAELRAVVWNSMGAILFFSVVSAVVVEVVGRLGVDTLSRHGYFSTWLGVSVLLTALFTLLSQLVLREHNYGLVARRSLLQAGVTSSSQLIFAACMRSANGLMLGHLLGRVSGIVSMARAVPEAIRRPAFSELWPAWRKYWKFPAVFAPSALLNAAGLQVPIIFVTLWYGTADGGQLGMAERIVTIPLTVIGSSIGQVIDAKVSSNIREGKRDLFGTYVKLSGSLGAIGLAVGLGFVALGPWIVPFLLGADWGLAGVAVRALAVTATIRLVATPLSKFLLLLERALLNTFLDIFRVAALIVSIVVVVSLKLDIGTALWVLYSSLSVTYLVTWICGLVLTWRVRS